MPVGYLVCPGTEQGDSGWYWTAEGHQHLYRVDKDQQPEVWTLGLPLPFYLPSSSERAVAVCQSKNGKLLRMTSG